MVGSLGTESLTAVSIIRTADLCVFSGRFRWTFRSGNLWSTVFRTGATKRLSECVSFEVVDHSGYCSGGDDSFCRRWRTVDRFVSPWFIPGDGCGRYVGAGRDYLHIMLFGLIPFAFTQIYAGSLREMGESMKPMVAGIVSVFVDIIFNYLLIYGKFGFQGWRCREQQSQPLWHVCRDAGRCGLDII